MTINLQEITALEAQGYLNHSIAPRPICFASTIDKAGNVNLSPFSFFNMFSYAPPIVIFAPVHRMRNNTTKHTLENVTEVPEVVINIVTYDMVQQTSLSSCEFPKGTDEFIKAGFTKEQSLLVKPPRVKESPVQLECKVLEIKSLGAGAGAGDLVIAEIMMIHLHDEILNEEKKIDQNKLDLVGRLGGNWYTRANASTIFEVDKPNSKIGIGVDGLPASIRQSKILCGNDLGQLANVTAIPDVTLSFDDDHLKNIIQYYSLNTDEMEKELHLYAKKLLTNGNVDNAWQVLLAGDI